MLRTIESVARMTPSDSPLVRAQDPGTQMVNWTTRAGLGARTIG
jgi:hypothetical protein